jgi:hypothetical protein
MSRGLLWLWHGERLGSQEAEIPLLVAGTRGLMKVQETERTECVCSEVHGVRISDSTRL